MRRKLSSINNIGLLLANFLALVFMLHPVSTVVAYSHPEIAPGHEVRIHPGAITTRVNDPTVGMSTLLFDPTGTPVTNGVTYEWGMSSDTGIGTLTQINHDLATFVPIRAGRGDIYVKSTYLGEVYIGSIPALVLPDINRIPGDVDQDAVVDIFDYNRLSGDYGFAGQCPLASDFDGDCDTDILDRTILITHFDTTL